MNVTKKTEGIKKENSRYVYEGNLVSEEDIVIDLDMGLFVTGYIKAGGWIKAGDYIKAGGSIKAGGYIKAGGWIEAGYYIEAGDWIKAGLGITAFLHITCKGNLKAGLRIIAGVCNWREITDEDRTITCGKLESGEMVGILKETGTEDDLVEITVEGNTKRISRLSAKELGLI